MKQTKCNLPLECQKPGNALCKIAADGEDIDPPCCDGSLCLPWLYGTPSNFYCQKMDLADGEPCGVNQECFFLSSNFVL